MSWTTSVRKVAGRALPPSWRLRLRHSAVGRPADYRWTRRTAAAYRAHAVRCRRQYPGRAGQAATLETFTWLQLWPVPQGGSPSPVTPSDWPALVARVAAAAADAFSRTTLSWLHPPVAHPRPLAADTPEVQRGEVVIQKLTEPLTLDGLRELCDALVPRLEQHVLRAYAKVDSVQVSRTYVSPLTPGGSFLWHHDEFPREVLKLLIYLNEVDEDTAPFTYLEDAGGRPVIGSPTPMLAASRITPERMEAYLARGGSVRALTGPPGTCVLFSPAIVHRATVARRGYRDALFLTLRPWDAPRRPYVDPRWTATVRHHDFSRDPEADLPPVLGFSFPSRG